MSFLSRDAGIGCASTQFGKAQAAIFSLVGPSFLPSHNLSLNLVKPSCTGYELVITAGIQEGWQVRKTQL